VAWRGESDERVLRRREADELPTSWLPDAPQPWFVASVNRAREARLIDWLHAQRPLDRYYRLTAHDFDLALDVEFPERVGVDRLAAALAAARLRSGPRPVIVVDAGTAITVDLVDAGGVFRGGAIMPGPYLMAESLHQFTEALPRVEFPHEAPVPIGRRTETALQSGLYWGVVGALRELVRQISRGQPDSPQLFITGGGPVADGLRDLTPLEVPDLVLQGIAQAGLRRLAASAV
jgi:type III pantothenate kinase